MVPIKISPKGPAISYLLFADDIILMAKADLANCGTMSTTLDSFCTLLGQRINKAKSRIYFSKNCSQDLKNLIEKNMNIKRANSICRYLGFPITNKCISSKEFQFLIDNLNSKLAGWKTKFLNIAGRTTLAKSSLSLVPTHIM